MGRLDALKDFPTLIRAFALLRSKRPCRLAILGEGAGRHDLERLVGELNLQDDVHLPGFIDNPFAWMRAAAVVVSSSLTEGCPNAVMQALACGTAVVSTNSVGGAAEILEGGRWGGLVPVKDAPAMAASMAASIDDKNRVDLRVRATDFALGGVARAYLQQLIPGLAAPAGRQ
jgi:glycosyltransferase involved in cell wall biosynthesis